MPRSPWPVALLGLCLVPAAAPAQNFPGPYGFGSVVGGGFSYSRGQPGRGLSVSFGVARGGYVLDPFGPACFPGGGRFTSLTIITPPPPPSILVFAPPPRDPLDMLPADLMPRPRALPPPPEPADPGPPGDPAGRFRPLAPDDRERARRPLPPPPPDPAPPKEAPKKEAPRPPADPRGESARLIDQGREAFAAGEFGRAALRFRQAARSVPAEPQAPFLLAQALFALGKYHEMLDAVTAGLADFPDWPRARFRPAGLYGAGDAEYADHLRSLADARGRHPGDPVLLFLAGYLLWFDGRRDEAGRLIRLARPGLPDRRAADRFLDALPPAPVS